MGRLKSLFKRTAADDVVLGAEADVQHLGQAALKSIADQASENDAPAPRAPRVRLSESGEPQ